MPHLISAANKEIKHVAQRQNFGIIKTGTENKAKQAIF